MLFSGAGGGEENGRRGEARREGEVACRKGSINPPLLLYGLSPPSFPSPPFPSAPHTCPPSPGELTSSSLLEMYVSGMIHIFQVGLSKNSNPLA